MSAFIIWDFKNLSFRPQTCQASCASPLHLVGEVHFHLTQSQSFSSPPPSLRFEEGPSVVQSLLSWRLKETVLTLLELYRNAWPYWNWHPPYSRCYSHKNLLWPQFQVSACVKRREAYLKYFHQFCAFYMFYLCFIFCISHQKNKAYLHFTKI